MPSKEMGNSGKRKKERKKTGHMTFKSKEDRSVSASPGAALLSEERESGFGRQDKSGRRCGVRNSNRGVNTP